MKTEIMVRIIKSLLREAGKIMLSAHGDAESSVTEKSGTSNFVTAYDVAVQGFLTGKLKEAIPDALFIAEENLNALGDNTSSVLKGEHCFIIDPIDGTTNFMHDYKRSSISLAMISHGTTVLGAIYDPYSDEMYFAELGKGAELNGKPISVSDREPEVALIAFGASPYYKDTLSEDSFTLIKKLFLSAADIRRSGSAALDMAHVASGRIDMFFELKLSPWDYAAGTLIIREAGGIVTDIHGKSPDLSRPCSIFAGTPKTYQVLMEAAGSIKGNPHI
ncbi:MAG: inositol monophosphatase [Ruminococcaceae bacterium]|nr:inositol monophosphatase [Oscillospiraceae bacterium]